METQKITKQVIDFQKMSFDNWYSALTLVQDQAVSAMDSMLDQAKWLPEDGRNAIQSWMGFVQDERNRIKGYVDDSFVTLEKAFKVAPKATAKPKK